MSISVNFNNQEIVEPGVYARTTSGEPVRPTDFPFGGIMIVDTGSFAGWGGGSGINGELANGKKAIYTFTNPNNFRSFVKGGEMFLFSPYLFNPADGASGPAQVSIVRACTTTSAKISKTFAAGSFAAKLKNEGKIGNGVLDDKKASIVFALLGSTLTVGAELNLDFKNGATVLQNINFDATSTSQLANHAAVVDAINSGNGGFTAKIIGAQIQVFAPDGFGASGNTLTMASTAEVDLVDAPQTITFAGGVNGTNLLKGCAMKVVAGEYDPAKFIAEFYLGTFAGKTNSGFNYGQTDEENSNPILLCTTDEIATVDELVFWAMNDYKFKQSFELVANESFATGAGVIINSDIDATFKLATGGTEVYNPSDLDAALEFLREEQNTFFVCDRVGAQARSVQNVKILDSVKNNSEFERFLIIGGGKDSTELEGSSNSSIEIAKFYNTHKVIVVHSGATLTDPISKIEEKFSSLLTTLNVAGRLGGLEPQEPLTFKALALTGYNHVLSPAERVRALKAGVLHIREVANMGNVVNQGVNTLQKNTVLWNPDGTSYEISIMSISSQLNKELILNLRPLFVGANRGRVTPADVKSSIEGYLMSQTTLDTDDKLINKFKNVNVTRVEDRFECTYSFEPNGPINKLLLTGFMMDSNI